MRTATGIGLATIAFAALNSALATRTVKRAAARLVGERRRDV